MTDTRTCINCVWCKENGSPASHLGCYYDMEWRMWLNKEKAKMFPLCLGTARPPQLLECNWQDKYTRNK
jgi:hypothetical protein